MAEKKGNKDSQEPRMEQGSERKKKTLLEFANELVQWFIFGGLLLRKDSPVVIPPGGTGGQAGHHMPSWIEKLFHHFSDADEISWDELMNTLSEDEQFKIFSFMEEIERPDNDWDQDKFRIRIVGEFCDAPPKNGQPSPATSTMKFLAKYDGDYPKQEAIALGKKLLVKMSPGKKFFYRLSHNKVDTALGIILALLAILVLVVAMASFV